MEPRLLDNDDLFPPFEWISWICLANICIINVVPAYDPFFVFELSIPRRLG